MKIFMSHSSRQKLLIKEIRHHLPQCMTVWIDEFELLGGSDVETELESAVAFACDYFIVFIDDHSVESEWVEREVGWALEREKELGRPFLLPVVIDQTALGRMATGEIAKRKFLASTFHRAVERCEGVVNS